MTGIEHNDFSSISGWSHDDAVGTITIAGGQGSSAGDGVTSVYRSFSVNSDQPFEVYARFYSQTDAYNLRIGVTIGGAYYSFGAEKMCCGEPAGGYSWGISQLNTYYGTVRNPQKTGRSSVVQMAFGDTPFYHANGVQTSVWHWLKIVSDGKGTLTPYYALNSTSLPSVWTVRTDLIRVITPAAVTEAFIGVYGAINPQLIDDLYMFSGSGITGFDASIPIGAYYLRTALNGGGNGRVSIPNPFDEVTSTTLIAQLKKAITYTNAFGVKQWQGETTSLDDGLHYAQFECAEMIRKTMSVEVLASPIVFSTYLRQWNGLVIEDKDGAFVSRGVTTSHIVAFEKADKKVYEGRATRDAFTIVQASDLTTPLVPNIVTNGLDEEMYYRDTWNTDTGQGHILIDNATADEFAVKYPTNLYEKFNNLTKLNKLEIKLIFSAGGSTSTGWSTAGGDNEQYQIHAYNYQSVAFEKIKSYNEGDLGGSFTNSDYAGYRYYDPKYLTIDIATELKTGVSDWATSTAYTSGNRVINEDVLYTCISNHTSGNTDDEPESGATSSTYWQRTVYDFINYESTAGSAAIFSKLNTIPVIRTYEHPSGRGMWVWDFSVKATFDEDNEPEYSTATISAVTATNITLNATSGINLPEKDGFGVGDIIRIVKNVNDYLADSWAASPIATDLGALTMNIATGATTGVLEDHTYKSFFALMQHISQLTNSTFWANYAATNTVLISSAGNHDPSGITLTKADLHGYYEGNFSISYDATKQKNKVRILGDNVNFIKTLAPALDPFDLGDETEIIDDSNIQTLLQASNMADSLTPRMQNSEVIVRLVLDYSNPNQNYANIKVGNTVLLQLPDSSDTSKFNDTLLIMAIDLNKNETTGDNEHATLSLQKRYTV